MCHFQDENIFILLDILNIYIYICPQDFETPLVVAAKNDNKKVVWVLMNMKAKTKAKVYCNMQLME